MAGKSRHVGRLAFFGRGEITRYGLLLGNIGFPFAVVASGFALEALVIEGILVALLSYALLHPACGWLGPVVTRFRPEGKEVWLTIDDGPCGDETVRLAEALHSRGVRATFFFIGRRVDDAREGVAVARVLEWGHLVGNHTYSHPAGLYIWLPPPVLEREIDRCSEALKGRGAVTPLFRSPVGFKHPWLHRSLARRAMRLVAWSARAHDGIRCEPDEVLARLQKAVRPGDILLMHEGRPKSIDAILSVVDHLAGRGFRFVIPPEDRFL